MHIHFFQTGGSIDKAYPRGENNHGYNFEICDPAFVRILSVIKPQFSFSAVTILRKDSLDITDDDRVSIVAAVEKSAHEKIVITHGTDTIYVTAEVLAKKCLPKTIVLTGSNLPELFKESDAAFNIGMAIGGVQVLPHGVYIALDGVVEDWRVYKKR